MYIKIFAKSPLKIKRLSSGMSIIELMVGLAIGLFILAGASSLFVNNAIYSRKILLESRINQDLRAAMDLITRDLRRGGYWANSLAGTVAGGSLGTATTNPYSAVSTQSSQINYAYTQDTENNALDIDTEQFGFRLNSGTLQMNIGGTWQAVTNVEIMSIPSNGFTITPTETTIDIRAACEKTCTDTIFAPSVPTSTQNCPRIQVRTYNIVLKGISKADSTIERSLRSQVRVRNDAILGSCTA